MTRLTGKIHLGYLTPKSPAANNKLDLKITFFSTVDSSLHFAWNATFSSYLFMLHFLAKVGETR